MHVCQCYYYYYYISNTIWIFIHLYFQLAWPSFFGQFAAVCKEKIQQALCYFDRLSITSPIWKLNFFQCWNCTVFKSRPLKWIATVLLYSNFCKCHFCDHCDHYTVCRWCAQVQWESFSFCVVLLFHCFALLEHKGHIHAVKGWAVTEPWLHLQGLLWTQSKGSEQCDEEQLLS